MHKSEEQESLDISSRKLIFMADFTTPIWNGIFQIHLKFSSLIFILDEEKIHHACRYWKMNRTYTNISSIKFNIYSFEIVFDT